jgi:hypothetical protein
MGLREVENGPLASSFEDAVGYLVVLRCCEYGSYSAWQLDNLAVALLKPRVSEHQADQVPPQPRPM